MFRIKNYKTYVRFRAKKEKEDLKFLIDKFEEDIKKMITEEKILEKEIEVMEKALKGCNVTIQDKDEWMDNEKLNMKDVELQILVMGFYKEEQIKVIDPLKMKLDDLKTFQLAVSTKNK